MDLPLSGTSGRYGGTGYRFKSDVGSWDRFYYAIIDKATGKALGTFSLMRIDQNNRVVEVGTVIFSPELKGTRIGTEAQYLLARYVFESLTIVAMSGNVIL